MVSVGSTHPHRKIEGRAQMATCEPIMVPTFTTTQAVLANGSTEQRRVAQQIMQEDSRFSHFVGTEIDGAVAVYFFDAWSRDPANRGGLTLLWYTRDDRLVGTVVGVDGVVIREIVA
jgi:hypothetical protein